MKEPGGGCKGGRRKTEKECGHRDCEDWLRFGHDSIELFNAELPPERSALGRTEIQAGWGGGGGPTIPNATLSQTRCFFH